MTHPVLQGMLMTGCQKQQNILLAFHTFMELSEVKVLWDIDYGYEKEMDIIFIKAKSEKNAKDHNYYVPISTSFNVSLEWINRVQDRMLKDNPNSSFILVIKERDSSSVYYKVSNGLVPPLSPEATKRKKSIEEKHRFLKSELKKRKTQLFTDAKNALSSTSSADTTVKNADETVQQNEKALNDKKTDDTTVEIILEDDNNATSIEIIEL